ncbi:MAG: B12-binding domain-containing radical SAM protein [Candidatus Heimdallarchaeota archaeon]
MSATNIRVLFVDATGSGKGKRIFTRVAIGAGARSICGVLESLNIDSKIILAEEVLQNGFPKGFTTLFLSGMTMDKIAIRKICMQWKKKFSGKVIIGGPITSEFAGALTATKADAIVIGEGELTLAELVTSGYLEINGTTEDIANTKGVGYIDRDGNIVINDFRPYSSRDEFHQFKPSTKRIKDYKNFFSAKVYVECVRGCSNFGGTRIKLPDGRSCSECGFCDTFSIEDRANCPSNIPPGCGFCSVPSLFGPAKSRSVNAIVKEIKELLNSKVKRIILSAPDILDFGRDITGQKYLVNPSQPEANLFVLEELLVKINKLNQVKNGKAWIEIENVKANLFTEKVAKLFAKYLPNSPFSIGCETGSVSHSQLLGKAGNPIDTLKAVKFAHKYGLKAHVYFIHSLPGQTEQTAKETVELIHKLEPYIEKVTIYRFRPLPMSAFGDFPQPQPAIKNPTSLMIANAANEVNLRKKKDFVGETVRVIISEPNYRDEKGAIAYILGGGPMIAVENALEKIGEILEVEIISAITEKLLLGRII